MKLRLSGLALAIIAAVTLPASGATWSVLHNFPTNSYPFGGLTQGNDGALYGTTQQGGAAGYGMIFRLQLNGDFAILYSFHYSDGAYPYAGLLFGQDGALYGTAQNGSSNSYGSVFRITTNGQFSTVAAFGLTNGAFPKGRLVQANNGLLYGTTFGGGDLGMGTVFRLTTNGSLTTLASFAVTNGARPVAGLTFGSDGALYGTTLQGGPNPTNFFENYGSVFRITTNGNFSSLALLNYTLATHPGAGFTLGSDGLLYGLGSGGYVFSMTTNGVITPILSALYENAGYDREADLLQYFDGAFYSVAAQGSSTGDGVLYRITTNGLISALIDFRFSGASRPMGKLLAGQDGYLYGTSTQGGLLGGGSVFRVEIQSSIFLFPLLRNANGWDLNFNGLPGDVYHVQRASTPSGPWNTFTNVAAGQFGDGHAHDVNSATSNVFYRLAYP